MPVGSEVATSSSSSVGQIADRPRLNVLVVDDDRALREGCASFCTAQGFGVTTTGSGNEALVLVSRRRFDVVLLDLYMSQVPGMEILKAIQATNKGTLVVMMTGNPSVETNLQAVQLGAWDYLLKPFTPAHLDVLMGRALQALDAARGATTERGTAATAARAAANSDLVTCIGVSAAFRAAVTLARRTAVTDASVMLSGESGTGKEVLAEVIHRHSHRASKRMVPVNCAALPDALLESEMFGHRKGAFTGADRDKPGLLEMANGGTLFLDELTEMSQRLQAKLLRVLQDGVVRRLGSEHQDAVVDVRFVSATNQDPHEAVRNSVLREDLFYRLRVVLIKLPPLRERVEDIPLLANHFLAHYWGRYRGTRDALPRFSAATMDVLRSRPWRGNVRELQNVVEHVAVLAEPGHAIRPDDIPVYDDDTGPVGDTAVPLQLLEDRYYSARDTLMGNFEYAYLSRLISRSGGNMSKAARTAGLDRTTLYRLLGRHSLRREDQAEPDEQSA
jgi:DNA-binding NtrC family response regulator